MGMMDFNEIEKKDVLIKQTVKLLKSKFVGIDKQIDEIMSNIRMWYLFPDIQERPVVVNIWGLSGTGKTELIKTIVKSLDLEKDCCYFNFASITESSSWEIEEQLTEEFGNESNKRLFIYDEFQYAATLNPSTGEERENKSALKPLWELLDSGRIHKKESYWKIGNIYRIIKYIDKIQGCRPIILKDGCWVNVVECMKNFDEFERIEYDCVFNIPYYDKPNSSIKDNEEGGLKRYDCDAVNIENQKMFINKRVLEDIRLVYNKINGKEEDVMEFYETIKKFNINELYDYLTDLFKKARKGYDIDFSQSLIIVIGNLDEAYEMSFNVNPDMSPDQFRKVSEEISVVDIKMALRKRFRNEQIARLGNTHIIYPSFSSKNFQLLINNTLNEFSIKCKELTGYDFVFTKKIKQIIYEEGVYPTHGARPLFTTIYEIVKSKLPEVMTLIFNNKLVDICRIEYSFSYAKDSVVINIYNTNSKKIKTHLIPVKLRLKKLRQTDGGEQQVLCALHESGHFVMYAKLFGKLPEKLVSKTTSSDVGGFLMESFDEVKRKISKNDMFNELCVLLGGYVAEKKFFGEEMTSGASQDLSVATKLASKMIRRYGMGSLGYVTTSVASTNDDPLGFHIFNDDEEKIRKEITDILTRALNETEKTFEQPEWRKMLKESSLYLSEHSFMPKQVMKTLYDKVSDKCKICRSNNYYRKIIEKI